jgi:hypothetical protein
LATQLYLSLANALTGREWFAQAWTIDELVRRLEAARAAPAAGGTA